jgi:hypothetical protein
MSHRRRAGSRRAGADLRQDGSGSRWRCAAMIRTSDELPRDWSGRWPRSQQVGDVLVGAVVGGCHARGHRHVMGEDCLTTALGVDDKPGYLAGYGDITAQHALELAGQHDATWQRILTEPTTGHVLDVGRHRYQPPAALKDHTLANIPTCTGPGCTRPAHLCDIDHAKPFPEGPTNEDNVHPACRTHHQAKTHGGWKVSKTRSEITWISPRGLRYTRKPEPIAEPELPPPFQITNAAASDRNQDTNDDNNQCRPAQ